jgi:hypothetical protein
MRNRVYLPHLCRALINYPIPSNRGRYANGDYFLLIYQPNNAITRA